MKLCVYTIVATILFLSPVLVVRAQTPCGNIIEPDDITKLQSPLVTTPIEDCALPFGEITANNPFSMTLEGSVVTNNAVLTVPAGGSDNYSFIDTATVNNEFQAGIRRVYKQVDGDYVYVETPLLTTEAEYRSLADAFLEEGIDSSPYVRAIMNGTVYEEFTEFEDQERYFNYEAYVSENKSIVYPKLTSGTYTVVWPVYGFGIGKADTSIWGRLAAWFLPSALAGYFDDPTLFYVYTVTFSIVEEPPEPTGASSVLFLPGIMGSRLFEESDECEDSFGEQERWISRTDCSQLRLVTDYLGNSENEIYTKDEISSVIDETFGLNLYKSFFNRLSDLKDNGVIENYAVVPYDWRLRLDDLLTASLDANTGKITLNPSRAVQDGYLYKKLQDLISRSKSGKVTIVAHSNGGLLTKALLATLQQSDDPLLDKIDNVILVAVPQEGTPGAVLGILQGDEIGPGGLVVSQQTARQLMNTMPFAFHLLPNSSYFDGPGVTVESPVIRFSNGTITTPWADIYGETITNVDKLHNFMQKESGRTMPVWADLLNPAVVDKALFAYTRSIEQLQKNWQPSTSTMVYQIAGVGIETPTTLTYFTDQECAARSPLSLYRCTKYQPKLGYDVDQTIDGDGTVVVPSALAMSESDTNVKRLWINLDTYNRSGVLGSNINRVHKDILEVPELIDFVQETLQGISTKSYEYLSTTAPQFTETDRMTFSLHSPLDMSLELSGGKIISSSTPYIDGAVYRRYGELQYISVPNSGTKKKIKLIGQSTGSFTLEVKKINGGNETKQSYVAIPSSTTTLVTGEFTDGNSLSNLVLVIDYDGNGSTDTNYTAVGEVTTYAQLKEYVTALNIKAIYKKVLLETIKIAEQNYIKSQTKPQFKKVEVLTLELLKQQVILYGRLRLISVSDQQGLIELINKLNK